MEISKSPTEITMEKVKAEWRQQWEEGLLSDENIERAAEKSYEDFRDLNMMPEDPRWPEVEEDIRADLRKGIRENTRYALDALASTHPNPEAGK